MSLPADSLQRFQEAGLTVRTQVPLSTLGSFQLGGPARIVIDCRAEEDLASAVKVLSGTDLPALLIGEGTNLLFSDQGWNGILVRCAECQSLPNQNEDGTWSVPAAMSLEALVDWAIDHEYSGLEPFAGIPGTVGGAVVGNAGAWGVQMADRLTSVTGWNPEGESIRFNLQECGFSYRDSLLKEQGYWVSKVDLALVNGSKSELLSEKQRILAERKKRHPEWRTEPCIGSFFKNLEPSSSAGRRQAAGWFLEQAGAKSCSVGGAAVYEKHANILVKQTAACTASDVANLAVQLQAVVLKQQGISMEREVRYLGELPGWQGQPGFW